MALVVGETTYISIADASTYFTANYLSTDAKLIAWNALSSPDKEVLLRKAAKILDQQRLIGIKYIPTQPMEFPRAIYSDSWKYAFNTIPYTLYGDYYIVEATDGVKFAQCEIAIDAMSPSKRTELQREGVKSFSLGSLSESYGGGTGASIPYTAREYLTPFRAGGVAIC